MRLGCRSKKIQQDRWHADETRWLVFASVEGKTGYKWYMWVFCSPSTVVYRLDKSRSAQVPIEHFGPVKEGILSVDRYSSYKAMAKLLNIILAFCWAHARRDSATKTWRPTPSSEVERAVGYSVINLSL